MNQVAPQSPPPAWMTPAQTAILLGVHVNTLWRWRKHGIGPPWHRVGPKGIRYNLAEIQTYMLSEENGKD